MQLFDSLSPYRPQALALLRIATALLFIEHGTQKLFDFPASGHAAASLGGLMLVAALLEAIGGILIAIGLFTRPVAFILSGEMAVGVSNHGSYQALGLNIDLSKPRKALLSTRLEARIRDKASGAVLWEGRADIATRDGDPKWSDQAIASRLAEALFAGFPGKNGETIEG